MDIREEQEMLSQIRIKNRSKSFKEREELYNKKYLGEIIAEENPEFKKNNLILSPVGSGKSHLIENMLIPKDYDKKILYLTSNSALKDSLAPDNNEVRKLLADNGVSVRFFTTKNKSKFGDAKYSVHVMTYAEFGQWVVNPNTELLDDVELVFGDEMHSLPRYFEYDNDYKLGVAMHWLLSNHDNIKKFYFTATRESIDNLEKRMPSSFKNFTFFDYLDHPEIRKYVANSVYYVNHLEQLRVHFRAKVEAFQYYGYKALAFTKLISEQERLSKIAEEEGYKPIVLWSINNERKMSEEQLKVREYILNTGNIPEPYNLLIINGAMQEGWNLFDDKVNWAILDTLDITEQIQALGRIRKDIDLIVKRTRNEKQVTFNIDLPDYYLNKELTQEDKEIICEDLKILDAKGRLRKWPTVKKYIKDSGYIIKDKTSTIDGKRTRVSIITVKD